MAEPQTRLPLAAEALQRVGSEGRLTAEDARELRLKLGELPSDDRSFAGRDPEDALGLFDRLPPEARAAIVRAVEQDEWSRIHGYDLGDWQFRLHEFLRSPGVRRVGGQLARLGAALLRSGPGRSLHEIHRWTATLQWRTTSRPNVGALLGGLEIDPASLAVCYARGLAQPAGFRGFWNEPKRHITVGSMLGIDLISSPEGMWFVESNIDAGLEIDRTSMYERDPFVLNLLACAQRGGYRHVLILTGNSPFDDLMIRQVESEATALGIDLEIIEDAYGRKSQYARSYRTPLTQDRDTLVVRNKKYRTNLDHLFGHKRATYRALHAYQQQTSDSGFLLPLTTPEPMIAEYDPRSPFPNLVYKFPARAKGSGVFFLKASSPDEARRLVEEIGGSPRERDLLTRVAEALDDHNGLYQPYVRGSLLEGRHLYKVRAHVLLTPLGPHFLSAHRTVSTHSVPEELSPGIVRDPGPYLVNFAVGAKYQRLPIEEEKRVEQAALGIARGLSWAAAYAFQTTPGDDPTLKKGEARSPS